MNVTVYGKADCQGCKATVRKLNQHHIDHEYLRADLDPVVAAKAATYGYLALPIVVVDLGEGAEWTWTGYRPSELDKLHKLMSGHDPHEIVAA